MNTATATTNPLRRLSNRLSRESVLNNLEEELTAHTLPQSQAERNPLQEALENYQKMVVDLAASQAELLNTTNDRTALLVENERLRAMNQEQKDFYQAQVDQLRKERDLFQGYALGIRTRFQVIKECINQAEAEAMQWAVKKFPAQAEAETPPSPSTPPTKLGSGLHIPIPSPVLPQGTTIDTRDLPPTPIAVKLSEESVESATAELVAQAKATTTSTPK